MRWHWPVRFRAPGAILLVVFATGHAGFAAAQNRTPERPVAEYPAEVAALLEAYRAAGFNLFYSNALVPPSLALAQRPDPQQTPGAPLEQLRTWLQPLGLTLRASHRQRWLVVRLPQQQTAQARRASDTDPQTDTLAGAADVLPELVVVSSRYRVGDEALLPAQQLTQADLNAVPEIGEDALRVLNHLPGMATLGLSAQPHIRGGLRDENLVLFNQIELLEPFHLRDFQSIFSGLNPSLIQSIDVFTGGFPARYGNRMSGVTDIQPNYPDTAFGGEAGLSLLTSSLALYGTAADGAGNWSASARRGNLDLVTRQVNDSVGEPRYADWLLQYRHQLRNGAEFDLGVLGYDDDVLLQEFDTDGEIASSSYENRYLWLQQRRELGLRWTSSWLLSYGRIRHRRDGLLFDEDLDNGSGTVDDRRDYRVWHLKQRTEFQQTARLKWEFGAELRHQDAAYDYTAAIRRGVLADFIGLPVELDLRSQVDLRGPSGGTFVSARWQATPRLAVEAGLRLDFQDYYQGGSETQLGPRGGLRLDLTDHSTLRLSAGRFYQPQSINELQVTDGLEQLQAPQSADHFIASFSHRFGASGLSLRAEAFQKRFRNPKRRFENLFNPLVLLPELAADRVEIAPSSARARGYELSLSYRPRPTFSAWLAYSDLEVEDRIENRWQPRAWDQGASIVGGLSWQPGRWQFSLSLQQHEGWRTTRLPDSVDGFDALTLKQAQARLPAFISWNTRLSRSWGSERDAFTLFFEVTNLLDRENVGGIEFSVEEDDADDAGGGFTVEGEPETLLPRVPSIGFTWRF